MLAWPLVPDPGVRPLSRVVIRAEVAFGSSPRSPGDMNEADARSEARFAAASGLSREDGEEAFLLLLRFFRAPPILMKDSMVLEGKHGSRTEARIAIRCRAECVKLVAGGGSDITLSGGR